MIAMDTPSFDHIFDQHLFSLEAKPEPPTFSRDFNAENDETVMDVAKDGAGEMTMEGFAEYVLLSMQFIKMFEYYVYKADGTSSLLSGFMIDVYVGRRRKPWSLHHNLLSKHTDYFDLNSHPCTNNPTSGNSTCNLPDEDPKAFALLVHYLYQSQLPTSPTSYLDPLDLYARAQTYLNLYHLSHLLSIPDLANEAIDSYRHHLHLAGLVPDAKEIGEIFRSCAPGSGMRELVVRIAARQVMDPGVEGRVEGYQDVFQGKEGAEFAVQLVKAIRKGSGGVLLEDPTADRGCEFHLHEENEMCESDVRSENRAERLHMSNSRYSGRSERQRSQLDSPRSREPPARIKADNILSAAPVSEQCFTAEKTPRMATPLRSVPSQKRTHSSLENPTAGRERCHKPVSPNVAPACSPLNIARSNAYGSAVSTKTSLRRPSPKSQGGKTFKASEDRSVSGCASFLHAGSENGTAPSLANSSRKRIPRKLETREPCCSKQATSRAGSGPDVSGSNGAVLNKSQEPNRVGGIVKRFDDLNCSDGKAATACVREVRRPPPKLRRKAGGGS